MFIIDNIKKFFLKLIPCVFSNKLVIGFFDLMRKIQKISKKDFSNQLKINEEKLKDHIDSIIHNNGFIEDQNNYSDMKYGKVTMKFSGCEIFATYNAIYSMVGKNIISLSEMIHEYEKDGMVLSGKFGTAPRAICDFFKRHGFDTQLSTKEADFDKIGEEHDSLILTMYNDRNDISKEVHTVNISKEKNGYTAHNVYCNGKIVGPYESVSEVIRNINDGKAKGISLIGIKKY